MIGNARFKLRQLILADRRVRLVGAYATLFIQLDLLFEICAQNRDRGHKPLSPLQFIRNFLAHRLLACGYPMWQADPV